MVFFASPYGELLVAEPGVIPFEKFVICIVFSGKVDQVFDGLVHLYKAKRFFLIEVSWIHVESIPLWILDDLFDGENAEYVTRRLFR